MKYLKSLASSGCIRLVLAPPEEQPKDTKTIYKTLEYIHDATPAVRAAFQSYVKLGQDISHDDDDEEDIDDVDIPLETTQDAPAATQIAHPAQSAISRGFLPLWDPQRPWLNFLFDIVQEGGPQGVSTMVSCAILKLALDMTKSSRT